MGSRTINLVRQHRFIRWGTITVLVLTLLGLLLLFAPRYLARYLLATQLDEMHIDHSGIETLTINPFTRELWLGPVRIGAGTSEAARLESLGLTLGYNPLLHRRIFIERLIIQGIDLDVTRDKNNRFVLNGIPLSELLPPPGTQARPNEKTWKPGIANFELRDSRLLFHDQRRGELAVDVERLSLMDFLAWKPQDPGRFELAGQVNEIQLNWSGEARPFADNITLVIDSRTEQADLPKVIRFTGPWGLDRRDGVYAARLKHELTLFHAGGLEGHTQGVIEVEGADYQRKEIFALELERAKSDLDIRYALKASGDLSLQGKLILDLGPSQVNVADQTRVGVSAGRVTMDKLDSAYGNNGNLRVDLRPELELEQVEFSGPIEISVDKLLNLLALLQSLSTGSEVTSADTGLGDFAGDAVSVPASDVKVERLHSQGESLSLQSTDGKLEFALKTRTDLSNIQVDVAEQQLKLERLQSDLEHLNLVSGQGRLQVEMASSDSVVAGSSKGPNGELKVGSLNSKLNQFDLQAQAGAIALQVAGENQVSGFSGLVYARQALPEVQLDLGEARSTLTQASLDVQGERMRWQVAGNATAAALAVEFAKGEESEIKFERAEIRNLQADERLQLTANALTMDGLDLYLKRSVLETLFKSKEDKSKGEDSGRKVGDTAGEKAVAGASDELVRAQTLLKALGYDPGDTDGRMGQDTEEAIKAFQTKEGIPVDGRMSAGLLAQLELRAAGSGNKADAGRAGLQIGQLELSGNPVIRFHDDVVDPPVKIDTVFKEFQVQHFSTKEQAQPSDLRLVARINEFTDLEVKGWSKGLSRTADMDLDLQVKNLELSTYSPYVVKLSGVYLESGQLDSQVTGKASGGLLKGQIQLDLDHMAFKPLSAEDAARVTDTMGVPLELAVSLLEDGAGHIALKLPLGGTLSKPDVDISSAVSKAIGGVLKRVFPPTLAVSLLSKLAKGGGPAFEPILFAPGSAELDEAGRRYVDEVAKFLKEHPKLSLKLCGRATARDLEQLRTAAAEKFQAKTEERVKVMPELPGGATTTPAEPEPAPAATQAPIPAAVAESLKALAVQRKSVVRAYLIDTSQIEVKRVPECRSTFKADDPGKPRVEVVF